MQRAMSRHTPFESVHNIAARNSQAILAHGDQHTIVGHREKV
jgi:hypothetical protein